MGNLREIMGKLRVNYGLRFTHKILWGKLENTCKNQCFTRLFLRYGALRQLWVKSIDFQLRRFSSNRQTRWAGIWNHKTIDLIPQISTL